MRPRFLLATGVFVAAAFAACAPKYVLYSSPQGDWKASVPWGWSVMVDKEGDHFTHINFIGPFEPQFFLGAPSLSIRWHSYYYPHTMADGSVESYASADDYIRQMQELVYGPERQMIQPVREVLVAGRKAKHFVVRSAAPVPERYGWGTSRDGRTDRVIVVRQHAFAVLPLSRGFYSLVYPATADGYPLYEPQFNRMVNSFLALKDGPTGPPLQEAPASKAASPFSR